MLEGISLDQLRAFVVAADEGSFSAAARKLSRAQSVISELVSGLEAQIGVPLFDRTGRYPKLTTDGTVLLGDARGVIASLDGLKARSKAITTGVEAELSIVVDVFFPMPAIAGAAERFRVQFPSTQLRIFAGALGGSYQPVLEGSASVGIVVGGLPQAGLREEGLTSVELAMVAAPHHPLARHAGKVPPSALQQHVQLVLTDRSEITAGREFGVLSALTWRFADLFAKHAFLLAGLGWGSMPLHAIQRDLEEGRLVRFTLEDEPPGGIVLPMAAVYPASAPPGPAGRWLIERLKQRT